VCAIAQLGLQAESELSEEKKREELDAAITQARVLLLRTHNIPPTTADDDPRIKALKPSFKEQLRASARDLLIEEEVRRRKYVHLLHCSLRQSHHHVCRAVKMNLANEGLEARKKEEEVTTKKRKAENDKAWEGKVRSHKILNHC
jgi:DnaJ family protein C protein 8